MKKLSYIMSVMLVALTLFSCNKAELPIAQQKADKIEFVNSDVVPNILVEGTQNNLVVLDKGFNVITINSNVPFQGGGYWVKSGFPEWSGCAMQPCLEDGTPLNEIDGRIYFGRQSSGTSYYLLSRLTGVQYTGDHRHSAIENIYAGKRTNYCNEGPLETIITVRVIGPNGTKYVDLGNIKGTASTRGKDQFDTYAKAKVKSISEITEGKKILSSDATNASAAAYPDYPALKAEWYSKTQNIVLTITDGENDLSLNIWGRKRENEVGRLLEYIKEGDMIELPVDINNDKEIIEIHTSAILKLDE